MAKTKKPETTLANIDLAKLHHELQVKLRAIEKKHGITIRATVNFETYPYPRKDED